MGKHRNDIKMDFSLIETYAEKIRRAAEELASSLSGGNVNKDTYSDVKCATEADVNYDNLMEALDLIQSKLLDDCDNLDLLAEKFSDEDKRVERIYQLNFNPGSNIH